MVYRITYATGQAADEYATYAEACEAVRAEWPDAEIGHDGDLSEGGDGTLCWADEGSSIGDAGQRAVAQITRRCACDSREGECRDSDCFTCRHDA